MSINKKMSMQEIADLAGVSKATISRIINQRGRYSKETEKKVLEIINTYGYTTNLYAKALREQKTHTIGLLVPDITNSFFSQLAYYLEIYFRDHGYSLFISNTNDNEELENQYLNEYISKSVDGIVAISHLFNMPRSVINSDVPIITLDRISISNKNIPYVVTDDEAAGFKGTQLLIDKGCKNIVCITPQIANYHIQNKRELGYKKALESNHILYNENHTFVLPVDTDSTSKAEILIKEILSKDKSIDGVFCGSDKIALGCLYGAKALEYDIPKDIKIIGFDNSLYSQLPSPSISTIGRCSNEMAKSTCENLIKMIDKDNVSVLNTIIPIEVIERESTG